MKPPTFLTNEQIRERHIIVPRHAVLNYVDKGFLAYIDEQSRAANATGGTFLVIAWPDGTVVFWTQPVATEPLDFEKIAVGYKWTRLTKFFEEALPPFAAR